MTTIAEFEARKTREAADAIIHPLVTVQQGSAVSRSSAIGSDWTRRLYGGDFLICEPPRDAPAISLVFVQSRDRNTGARRPEDLGGGPTDKHLIYEGLSRVAADGVLAGAGTLGGTAVFFSVWHPKLIELRTQLGLPRHPAQVVVSKDGRLDLDGTLLFNVPDVPVFILAGEICHDRCRRYLTSRPWVTVEPIGPGHAEDLRAAFRRLRRRHGLRRISAIGGRTTASSLIDANLVQDVCLTTSPRPGGEPDTPFYVGPRPPALELIVRKRETDVEEPILFEQWRIQGPSMASG